MKQNARAFVNSGPAISFGYDSPLKDIARHCAYCGREMLTEEEAQRLAVKILRISGLQLQKELKFVKTLLGQSDKYNSRSIIISALINMSLENPQMSGQEVISSYLKENYEKFVESIDNKKKESIFQQLKELKPLQPELIQKEIDKLIELNPTMLITLYNEIGVIKRKADKARLTLSNKLLDFCDWAREQHEILEKNKMLQLAHKESPQTLLNKIIMPVQITLEHVHPHSKGGPDHTYNYLPVCSECNSDRGNVDFPVVLKENPELVKFIKRSLEEVKRAITNLPNPVEELRNYIQEITKTLKHESQGQLNIQV